MQLPLKHPIFKILSGIAAEKGIEAYVIGGYVRDLLLQRPSQDIDIVVHGSGIELAETAARRLGNLRVSVFKNFGTAMFRYKGMEIEFVGARKESYRANSRKPIVEEGTIDDDQKRRDFTINALAISLNQENYGVLIDPFGGLQHLEERLIKTPLEPGLTFSDDPLRMMRAIRFASQLNFQIEENTFQAIAEYRHRLPIVSMERIMDEFNKIMLSPEPSRGIRLLDEADITSKNEEKVKRFLENFKTVRLKLKEVEEKDSIRNFQPPISGEEIIATFHLPPCKTIGDIKNAIKEAILDGIIGNNYEEAREYMFKVAKELGIDSQ